MDPTTPRITVFSTCPQSKDVEREAYVQRVADVARWSEAAGCTGMLVYTDNGLVDPWLVSQVILQSTATLSPLVAVQPLYMHPYAAAKMVSSLAHLHGRRIYLNMLAGGFKNDLEALDDPTPHDERYARTVEYSRIITSLLGTSGPVTFEGTYYRVRNLRMTPPLPAELFPGILISGSSPAGAAAAKEIGATAVKYPEPPGEEPVRLGDAVDAGVRVGIIARATAEEAWSVARARFPADRKGQLTHKLAMKASDSVWHRTLSERDTGDASEHNPYWLEPFRNYKTFCPYLVGSYGRVAEEVAGYVERGFRTFVLDIPPDEEELHHTAAVFREAAEGHR